MKCGRTHMAKAIEVVVSCQTHQMNTSEFFCCLVVVSGFPSFDSFAILAFHFECVCMWGPQAVCRFSSFFYLQTNSFIHK